MRWTTPSWAAIVLGILTKIIGFVIFFTTDLTGPAGAKNLALVAPALLSGAILLAAGLLGLQVACSGCGSGCGYGGRGGCGCCDDDCSCGDCGDCSGGCSCCKDGCSCGDCGECGGKGESEHGHAHGHD